MMTTNCTGERSFSKLKWIKNSHRSTISQDRLNSLALLCIESELLNTIDFNDIIKQFADGKVRNVPL